MIFDSTECEDETNGMYIAATLRPWVPGSFILDENPTTIDATIYSVKINTPSQSSFADTHRFMRMPYSISKHDETMGLFNIPVLAFQNTDWMHSTTHPMFRHVVECGEASLLHMRQMLFLFCERMRLHPTIIRFLQVHENISDLIYYPSRDEPERTEGQHIAFWYERLFNMSFRVEELDEAEPEEAEEEAEPVAEAEEPESQPFEPLGWNELPSQWPAFVYQNHVRMEMSKGTECPITLTRLADMTEFAVNPKCGHIFEPTAFTRWLKDASERGEPLVCPLCRTEVPNGAMYIRFGTE